MARKYWLMLLTLFLVCALVPPANAQGVTTESKIAGHDEQLAQLLQKLRVRLDELRLPAKFPGATTGFVLPDGRSGAVSTGVSDLATNTPLKPTDRLLAGSIGKTFVAAVTLLLAQAGKLNPDDKLERWLGAEKWFGQLPNARAITLRMLLNHSSGIPNHVDNGGFIKAELKNSAKDIRYEELVAYVLNKKPLFAAGKGHHYSDTNYILVGMIVEKATGKSLYSEISARILQPLKLDRTIPSDSHALPETANGYFKNEPMIVGGKFIINPQWEWAGGGFASTAEDLARWAKALYEGKVLEPKSLAEMLQSTTTGDGANYGLGVEIVQSKFGKSYGHDGEFPGYLSDMRYFPQYQIAIAVQVNADETPAVQKFINSAVEDFAQLIIEEISDRKLDEAEKSKLQALASNWLKLIDAGKFAESWEALVPELKAKYAQEKWQSALQSLLNKAGKVKTRTLKSVVYADPQNETVAVEFASSFAKAAFAREIITLHRAADGSWRVAGYSIK